MRAPGSREPVGSVGQGLGRHLRSAESRDTAPGVMLLLPPQLPAFPTALIGSSQDSTETPGFFLQLHTPFSVNTRQPPSPPSPVSPIRDTVKAQ